MRNLKKSNELLYKEKKLLGDDLEEEKKKVEKLEEEMKELTVEGNSKTIEVDKDDDDEDDDWETGNDDEDRVENRDSSGEIKKLKLKIKEYESELKALKQEGKANKQALALTSSPSSNGEKDHIDSLRLQVLREKKEKEKALKLVIDLVGKKRFTNILNSGKDLNAVKKIVRSKLNQSSSSNSSGNTYGEQKHRPHVGQGAWWSTRYMDEVQTVSPRRGKRSPRSGTNTYHSSPNGSSPRSEGVRAVGDERDALAEYQKWIRIAERQKLHAHAMKAPFVGGGRRQTYFSNLRDSHNDKIKTINSAGKDAIIKAAEAYKMANNY